MPIRISIEGFEKLHEKAAKLKGGSERIELGLREESDMFANRVLANIKKNYLTGPRPERLGVGTGNLRSKIRFRINSAGKVTSIRFGTDVPYAATHEFGDDRSIPITEKMRSFFWFKFFKTGDVKFKAMALTKKTAFQIHIKARPFLNPGVTDEIPNFQNRIRLMLAQAAGL